MKTIFTDRLDVRWSIHRGQIRFVPPISPARIMDPLAMSNVVELWSIPMLRRDLGTTATARVRPNQCGWIGRLRIVGASFQNALDDDGLISPGDPESSTTLA